MTATIQELDSIVHDFSERMLKISADDFDLKPKPEKWSKKEIVGHLIDSGQNNLRRFICGQYETTPPKIVYEQDFLGKANGYQQYKQKDIVSLWKLTNNQISSVLASMETQKYQKTAKTDKNSEDEKTLEWLAADYVKHMKHHLNQIIKNSFDITYP